MYTYICIHIYIYIFTAHSSRYVYICIHTLTAHSSQFSWPQSRPQDKKTHCNTLQHATTRCNIYCHTLQHTAKTLQHSAIHTKQARDLTPNSQDSRLSIPPATTHFSTLQRTPTQCHTMPHKATHYKTLQNTATNCNKLQHTHCNIHCNAHCNIPQHTICSIDPPFSEIGHAHSTFSSHTHLVAHTRVRSMSQ